MDAFAGDRTNESAMLGSRGCRSPRVQGSLCMCSERSVCHAPVASSSTNTRVPRSSARAMHKS